MTIDYDILSLFSDTKLRVKLICTGCPKKKWDLCSRLVLRGYMASNQKVEDKRPPLKFNFTYWEGFSALYTTCIHHVYPMYTI